MHGVPGVIVWQSVMEGRRLKLIVTVPLLWATEQTVLLRKQENAIHNLAPDLLTAGGAAGVNAVNLVMMGLGRENSMKLVVFALSRQMAALTVLFLRLGHAMISPVSPEIVMRHGIMTSVCRSQPKECNILIPWVIFALG